MLEKFARFRVKYGAATRNEHGDELEYEHHEQDDQVADEVFVHGQ